MLAGSTIAIETWKGRRLSGVAPFHYAWVGDPQRQRGGQVQRVRTSDGAFCVLARALGIVPGEGLGKIVLMGEFEMGRLRTGIERSACGTALGHRALTVVMCLSRLVDQRRCVCTGKFFHRAFPLAIR